MLCKLTPEEEVRMHILLKGIADDPNALEMQKFIQHGSVTTYEYGAEDVFRFPEDPHLPGQPLSDPLLPDDRPNRLLVLKREAEIVRGRTEWRSHARFSYRWLPGKADLSMGRRAPSLRPMCTSTREYWGVPPKATPFRRVDIGYGPATNPGDWTWDSSERPVATYADGALQGTSEYEVTVEDFGILAQHSPTKRVPAWSQYRWWDFNHDYFNMRYMGATTVKYPEGSEAVRLYEHVHFIYARAIDRERESCYTVETGSLGRQSPYETWKDARDPRYRMAGAKYEWYPHDQANTGGLMKTRTDTRGTELRFEYADEFVPHGRLVRLYESGKAPAASPEAVTISYDEPGLGSPARRGLPTSIQVPSGVDTATVAEAKALLAWDEAGRLATMVLAAEDGATSPVLKLDYNAEGRLTSVQHGTAAPKAVRLRTAFDSAWGEGLKRVFETAGGKRHREASRLYLQKYLISGGTDEPTAEE